MRRIALFLALALAAAPLFAARGQTSLVAGMGIYDGDGNTIPSATLNAPKGVAAHGTTVYVADSSNNVIRKVDLSTGAVTTLAGTGTAGSTNGALLSARFSNPMALCADPSGNTIYVADSSNNRIRGINLVTSLVYTVAGSGAAGSADGAAASCTFYTPQAIVMSGDGAYLYTADYGSNKIRRVDVATGYTSTIAGSGTAGYLEGTGTAARFNHPAGLAISADDSVLYVGDQSNNCVRAINLSTMETSLVAGSSANPGYQEGTGASAYFNAPRGVALDSVAGRLYVADSGNYMVRSIGLPGYDTRHEAGTGSQGDREGNSVTAMFGQQYGLCYFGGRLYIADPGTGKVKVMDPANDNYTKPFLGLGTYGGDGNTIPWAVLAGPVDVDINTLTGALYVADTNNNVIRMISPSGVVSTLAGSGAAGYAEGVGAAALLSMPAAVSVDPYRNKLYFSDYGNNRIRAVDLSTGATSLVAGSGSAAFADGVGALASFKYPQQIDTDVFNNRLYVADSGNNRIRAIDLATGEATTLAGGDSGGTGGLYLEGVGTAAIFSSPCGLVFDNSENYPMIFVADTRNKIVRLIDVTTQQTYRMVGAVTTTVTEVDGPLGSAVFGYPYRLAYDHTTKMLYLFDSHYPNSTGTGCRIKQAQLTTGGMVSTLAGGTPTPGYLEGTGTSARFSEYGGLAMDVANQVLYVADSGNNRVRKIDASLATLTPTPTLTGTRTPTAAGTPTVTPTFTDTPTETTVCSPTVTPTVTPTLTVTETRTATGTCTDSPTPTETFSSTPTRTATQTPTVTPTSTDSPTVTVTVTESQTFTFTPTLSATLTATVTQTGTQTPFVTDTPTYTQTLTRTCTMTMTVTPTVTVTGTQEATGTFTLTATPSSSQTPGSTATMSSTETPTEQVTASLTVTPGTGTASFTPTGTPQPAYTPTQSPTAVGYADRTISINEVIIYPNPTYGRPRIVYDINGNAVSVTVRIYTSGFRLVRQYVYENIPSGRHDDTTYDLMDLTAGVYHVLVTAKGTGGDGARMVKEMVVLR